MKPTARQLLTDGRGSFTVRCSTPGCQCQVKARLWRATVDATAQIAQLGYRQIAGRWYCATHATQEPTP